MGLGGFAASRGAVVGGAVAGICCGSADEDSLLMEREFMIPLPTERGDAVPASSMLFDSCCNSYRACVLICLEGGNGYRTLILFHNSCHS